MKTVMLELVDREGYLNNHSNKRDYGDIPDIIHVKSDYVNNGCIYKRNILNYIPHEDSPNTVVGHDELKYFREVNIATLEEVSGDTIAHRPNVVNTETIIDLNTVFKTAEQVKPRLKSTVALHLGAEVGEINECLIQPERGGNIVEESVDAILCAIDLIYLELGTTHGKPEIARIIQKHIEAKCAKWAETCKRD